MASPGAVEDEAAARALPVLNATCPLVTKVHNQGKRYVAQGRRRDPDRPCRPSGGRGHHGPDLRTGASGADRTRRRRRSPFAADTPVAYVTQTTLSVDDTRGIIAALQRRFTDIVGPDTRDICYATQNRQTAVRELSKLVDVILVVGAKNSSNSNRLREIGAEVGHPELSDRRRQRGRAGLVHGAETVGITAGASAPEVLVEDVIDAAARGLARSRSATLPGTAGDHRVPAAGRNSIDGITASRATRNSRKPGGRRPRTV